MRSFRPSMVIALRALSRNKLQTALTMVGMTIGVATVLTMIALGSGAESAIEDQVRAAGMNIIVVTAGNYKTKTEDQEGAVEEQGRLLEQRPFAPAMWDPRQPVPLRRVFHPEDDPMEKHDHPLASQRLGDSEAGLGAAATLTAGGRRRDPSDQRRAIRLRGDSQQRARRIRRQAMVHASFMAAIPRFRRSGVPGPSNTAASSANASSRRPSR